MLGYSLRPLLEALLPLPTIPIQRPRNTIHPVLTPTPLGQHVRKGVTARADGDIISRTQLHPLPTVETRPGARARVVGDADAEDDGVGEDDGPEGEGVGADGGDEDDGVFGVAEGTAGGEVVGGGSRRGGDADSVGLDGGEMFIVAEDFDGGHGWKERECQYFHRGCDHDSWSNKCRRNSR